MINPQPVVLAKNHTLRPLKQLGIMNNILVILLKKNTTDLFAVVGMYQLDQSLISSLVSLSTLKISKYEVKL